MDRISIEEIKEWPDSWAGLDEDIEYGQELIRLMIPFVKELEKTYSFRTVRNHLDNLRVLGGEIIRELSRAKEIDETAGPPDPGEFLLDAIDSGEGSLVNDFDEYEQEGFDRTCRKFYKYLSRKEEKKN